MNNENTNWKRPLIAFLIMSLMGIIPPIILDMSYNSDSYLSSGMNVSMIQQAVHSIQGDVEIGPITYQEIAPDNKKPTKIVKEQIKSQSEPQIKKLVCKNPRPLIQGSGTVRVCDWE